MGNKLETQFQHKVQNGHKIHTFRTDKRWKPGMKIHPYSGNPRNGGAEFNIQIQHAANWYLPSRRKNYPREQLGRLKHVWPINYIPKHQEAVPIVDGLESFEMAIHEFGANGTMVQLWIDEVKMFEVTYRPIESEIRFKDGRDFERLTEIANNDGLSGMDFLRWFIQLSRKSGEKVITGPIIHWTPKRYVGGTGFDPFLDGGKEDAMKMKKANLGGKIYL